MPGRKRRKPKDLVYFVDRCLGSGVVPRTLSEAGYTVVVHDDEFPQDTLDVEWLPIVGARGWIVLTQDKRIRRNQAEVIKVREAGVKFFALGKASLRGQEKADLLLKALPRIARLAEKYPGYVVATITKSGAVNQIAPARKKRYPKPGEED